MIVYTLLNKLKNNKSVKIKKIICILIVINYVKIIYYINILLKKLQ